MFQTEKSLQALSASQLRTLLLEEVKSFVQGLEYVSMEELQQKRNHLISIFSILSEKEKIELGPLLWGKNSPKPSIEPSGQPDSTLI